MHAADREGSVGVAKWCEEVCYKSRLDFVVSVNEADIVTGSFLNAVVSGGGLALVFLVDYGDTGVFLRVFVGDFARIVGGSVVY